MKAYIDHQQVSRFEAKEVACAVFALNSTRLAFGTLQGLPPGALHTVGGLFPETAAQLEEFLYHLAGEGVVNPTVPRVMAELDIHGMIN